MAILDVTNDNQLVHQTLQTVFDDIAVCDFLPGLGFVNGNSAILIDSTLITVSSYFCLLARSCRIVEELQYVWSFHAILLTAVGVWVNIPRHSIVRRQNQTVLRVHRKQVGQEVQLVNSPIDDVHDSGVSQSRICYRLELCRGKYLVGHVNHTITTHETRVDVCCRNTYGLFGVIKHIFELRRDGLCKYGQHVNLEELGKRSLRDTVDFTVFCLQILTSIVPPVAQGLVGRNYHSTCVVVHVGISRGADVLVPSWIEWQLGGNSPTVRCSKI